MSLQKIQQIAGQSAPFDEVLGRLQQNRPLDVTGLAGSSRAVLLAFLSRRLNVPVLAITAEPNAAEELTDDLTELLGQAHYFQSWDTVPYESGPPSVEVMASRMETIAALQSQTAEQTAPVVTTTIRALMQRTMPTDLLRDRTIHLSIGSNVSLSELIRHLVNLGFERLPLVEEVGQFSVRGGIVDIFPHGYENPLRVELVGDRIESLRLFDVFSQRSIENRKGAVILPRREFLISSEELCAAAVTAPNRSALSLLADDPSLHGLQWVAPLFPHVASSLLDHLPPEAVILLDSPEDIVHQADGVLEEAEREYQRRETEERIVPPDDLFDAPEQLLGRLTQFRLLRHRPLGRAELDLGIRSQEPFGGELKRLRQALVKYLRDGYGTFILCDNSGQAKRLGELLEDPPAGLEISVGALHGGFVFPGAGLAVFTDHQIFNRYRQRHRFWKFRGGAAISSYSALSPGDFVVHVDYGIGKYQGLHQIEVDGRRMDCLLILYRDDDRLYVPVDQLKRVQKYTGGDSGPPSLSRLGGTGWERIKSRTKKAIRDMTRELIQLYAERKAKQGHVFSSDTVWQKELEAAFIYEETPDQISAIEAIKGDMESASPMDRLVCGDVGYGKTEVAIRAAFKAVMDGRQVAVLAPTTILAQQHLTTFADRLADFPVRVDMLSRFRTRKEQKAILEELKKGAIDVVVGTHRLIQKDVKFKDLGLVIVDEEQRFGVAHKERLKQLRRLVDVLTLTATPIPRTLYMSLMRARDLSVINTPPRDRRPIKTEFLEFNEQAIAEAILRELDRGGQVYFVHNRVQSIQAMAALVGRIVPQARIGVAHGQMPERVLERTMMRFLRREYDVLVSTTIIENGLDIPNVNTIVINRADAFGLAQLYQLRGRVGRSHHLAYAYLLTPPLKTLSAVARKRLSALREFTALGSGFQLAMRDLEIRGSGNILGPQQHGFIAAVGFDLYCQLLREAVQELQGEKIPDVPEPRLHLRIDAYIPEDYIPDEGQKVSICQRLSRSTSLDSIEEIRRELEDRYGPLPPAAGSLLDLTIINLLSREKGIDLVAVQDHSLLLEFRSERVPTAEQISKILDRIEYDIQFLSGERFAARISLPRWKPAEQLEHIKKTLQKL
jgi:transcription-repair coupling factor (superfamily II helicase)